MLSHLGKLKRSVKTRDIRYIMKYIKKMHPYYKTFRFPSCNEFETERKKKNCLFSGIINQPQQMTLKMKRILWNDFHKNVEIWIIETFFWEDLLEINLHIHLIFLVVWRYSHSVCQGCIGSPCSTLLLGWKKQA